METARLDRRIAIEERSVTRDTTYGTAASETWRAVCIVRAQVQDMLPSRAERISEAIDVTRRPCRVRIRWRAGITGEMRVNHGGRLMQIVSGPTEIGRREWLEMLCEDISTEGVKP